MAKPVKLTAKQEAFALAYVATGNAAEAYRQSYDVGESTKHQVIWNEASKVLGNRYVSVRVMELQQAAQERTLVTVESLTKELEAARKLASKLKNAAAMTGAIMGKAKLNGLLVDRVGDPSGKPLAPTTIIERTIVKASN